MSMKKRKTVIASIVSICLVCSLVFLGGCGAKKETSANFPEKDITVIIPFTAGGASDVQARIVEKYFKEEFGVNLIFEYKEGAGGEIGFTELAKAKPDGYTIGGLNMPHIVLQPLARQTQYDSDSFEYICQVVNDPQILAVSKSSPYNSLEDVVKAAKDKKLTIATVGTFTGNHLATLDFMKKADIDLNIVPVQGSADQLTSLQGGHVDLIMGNLNDLARDPESYKLLAITTEESHPMMPEVKTFKEQGFEVDSGITRLFAVPKGTDPAVVERLQKGFENICKNPNYIEDMKKIGQPEEYINGKDLKPMIDKEKEKQKDILDSFGLLKK